MIVTNCRWCGTLFEPDPSTDERKTKCCPSCKEARLASEGTNPDEDPRWKRFRRILEDARKADQQ